MHIECNTLCTVNQFVGRTCVVNCMKPASFTNEMCCGMCFTFVSGVGGGTCERIVKHSHFHHFTVHASHTCCSRYGECVFCIQCAACVRACSACMECFRHNCVTVLGAQVLCDRGVNNGELHRTALVLYIRINHALSSDVMMCIIVRN